MSESTPEAQLLGRVALRDRKAFQELYRLTSPRLFAIALRMLNDRAQAEDLLQDVYLKVWHSAEDYDANRGGATAWLTSIVRNRAIDMIRRRVQSSSSADAPFDATELLPPEEGRGHRLQECLDDLEAPQRQSIFAAFFQGLSHAEIAARFEEPIGTIKSRVRRGLAALRGCLES